MRASSSSPHMMTMDCAPRQSAQARWIMSSKRTSSIFVGSSRARALDIGSHLQPGVEAERSDLEFASHAALFARCVKRTVRRGFLPTDHTLRRKYRDYDSVLSQPSSVVAGLVLTSQP